MKQVTAYQSDSGKLHTSRDDAIRDDAMEALTPFRPSCSEYDVDPDELIGWVVNNSTAIRKYLSTVSEEDRPNA